MELILSDSDCNRIAEMTALKLFEMMKAAENKPERKRIDGIIGLAKYIGCAPSTAQRIKNQKRVKSYQSGRKVFFYSDEVDNYLKK
jgi:hypothetical protein